jgi:nicotinamidase/pyrazinamidase
MSVSEMEKTAILVVDVQRDFCPGGSLAVPEGDGVVPVLNRVMERTGVAVYASRDWHPAGSAHFERWPPHCVQGTAGAELHPELALPPGARIVSKGTDPDDDGGYSAFDGALPDHTRLADDLDARGIEHLVVGGLATDYCVKESVLDALRRGYRVTVLTDAISGIDAEEGDSDSALEAMRRAGARLVSSNRLLEEDRL